MRQPILVPNRWILTLLLMILASHATGQDASRLADKMQRWQAAVASGDVDELARLIAPEATWLPSTERTPKSVSSNIDAIVSRHATLRVLGQTLHITGDTAIGTELLGARVGVNTPEVPQHRTTVWSWDNGTTGWRLAHLQLSEFTRWESAIKAFEQSDQESAPQARGIVFVGSSSIRRWETLTEDFPDVGAIGRGFGGSQLIDTILYAHRVVTPYVPRAVVVYAGDNDIAAGRSATNVVDDFRELVRTIHHQLPETSIGFISIKPSPARWELWPAMSDANGRIKELAERHNQISYLDIATPMLGLDGTPRAELFVEDGLHLTPLGYQLWTEVLRPWVNSQ